MSCVTPDVTSAVISATYRVAGTSQADQWQVGWSLFSHHSAHLREVVNALTLLDQSGLPVCFCKKCPACWSRPHGVATFCIFYLFLCFGHGRCCSFTFLVDIWQHFRSKALSLKSICRKRSNYWTRWTETLSSQPTEVQKRPYWYKTHPAKTRNGHCFGLKQTPLNNRQPSLRAWMVSFQTNMLGGLIRQTGDRNEQCCTLFSASRKGAWELIMFLLISHLFAY
jgi:hypothetical protein